MRGVFHPLEAWQKKMKRRWGRRKSAVGHGGRRLRPDLDVSGREVNSLDPRGKSFLIVLNGWPVGMDAWLPPLKEASRVSSGSEGIQQQLLGNLGLEA